MALDGFVNKNSVLIFNSSFQRLREEQKHLANAFNECPKECDIILTLIVDRLLEINKYFHELDNLTIKAKAF